MKGSKREVSEKKLYVGFSEAWPIAVNPNNAKLKEIGFNVSEEAEEPSYEFEKDGVRGMRLDFIHKDKSTGYIFKKTFFLQDIVVKSKTDKTQYINQVGDSFYSDDKTNLPDFFTKFQKNTSKTDNTKIILGEKEFREAKVGEAELMDFIKKWLDFDYFSVQTNILLDLKKIFRGDFKELSSSFSTEAERAAYDKNPTLKREKDDRPVIWPLGIKTVNKDGATKEYQDVYKTCLTNGFMNVIRNTAKNDGFSEENLQKWAKEAYDKNKNPGGRYLKEHEKLALLITDSQYPWNSFFAFTPIKEYDPEDNFVSTGAVVADVDEDEPAF